MGIVGFILGYWLGKGSQKRKEKRWRRIRMVLKALAKLFLALMSAVRALGGKIREKD